jgi:hypothetical protein
MPRTTQFCQIPKLFTFFRPELSICACSSTCTSAPNSDESGAQSHTDSAHASLRAPQCVTINQHRGRGRLTTDATLAHGKNCCCNALLLCRNFRFPTSCYITVSPWRPCPSVLTTCLLHYEVCQPVSIPQGCKIPWIFQDFTKPIGRLF